MATLRVPPEVDAIFTIPRLSSPSPRTTPITWPTMALPARRGQARHHHRLIEYKAYNVRRSPGSPCCSPTRPAAVWPRAGGDRATPAAPTEIVTQSELDALGGLLHGPPQILGQVLRLTRWPGIANWCLMRLLIHITPRRIRWWPEGDFSRPAAELEVDHVA